MKSAAIELWNTKVDLATIKKQLKMPERTQSMILGKEKQSLAWPIPDGKKSPGSGSQKRTINKETLKKMMWFLW